MSAGTLEKEIILPGLVDPYVHLRDPGYTAAEDFDTGKEVGVRLSMGATAAEAATLLTESRNWPSMISSVLQDYANTVE